MEREPCVGQYTVSVSECWSGFLWFSFLNLSTYSTQAADIWFSYTIYQYFHVSLLCDVKRFSQDWTWIEYTHLLLYVPAAHSLSIRSHVLRMVDINVLFCVSVLSSCVLTLLMRTFSSSLYDTSLNWSRLNTMLRVSGMYHYHEKWQHCVSVDLWN